MKVGILTMSRIINYGSFLQAYGLQSMLQEMGFETEFLDIDARSYRDMYPKNPQYRKNMRKAKLHRLLGQKTIAQTMMQEQEAWKYYYTLYHLFPHWWKQYLNIDSESNLCTTYDRIIVGSDEVFHCTQESPWGQSMKWFGDGLQTDILISYAASFGHTTMEALHDFALPQTVSHHLKNFNAISVRDENSRQIVTQLGCTAQVHLDPVLLCDYKDIVPSEIPSDDIFIIYTYPNRLKEEAIIRQILELARKETLRVISIGAYYPWCENLVLTPFEVLAYFKKAKYVVTDTFHGTVYSIKYGCPFVTLVRESNREKLLDLLMRFEQQEAAITPESNLEAMLHRTIPYSIIQEKIWQERIRTNQYLRENLRERQ